MGCFTWLINLANGLRSVPIAFIPFIEASTNDVPLPHIMDQKSSSTPSSGLYSSIRALATWGIIIAGYA